MYEHCKTCTHDDGDIGWCDKCAYTIFHRKTGLPPTEYERREEPKSITNADRIRAMTDEELVEIFANNECWYCRIHDFCFAKGLAIDCEDAWLDWLKQEVKDD